MEIHVHRNHDDPEDNLVHVQAFPHGSSGGGLVIIKAAQAAEGEEQAHHHLLHIAQANQVYHDLQHVAGQLANLYEAVGLEGKAYGTSKILAALTAALPVSLDNIRNDHREQFAAKGHELHEHLK